MQYSNWFTLLLLYNSAPLVLCCDRFDHGSSQVKREPVELVTEDYDVSLCQYLFKFVGKKTNWQHNKTKHHSTDTTQTSTTMIIYNNDDLHLLQQFIFIINTTGTKIVQHQNPWILQSCRGHKAFSHSH